jgi:hypothetical protein
MDVNAAIQAVDHAAHQDDRWMFVALLAIGLVTIYFLARYFMRQISARSPAFVRISRLT